MTVWWPQKRDNVAQREPRPSRDPNDDNILSAAQGCMKVVVYISLKRDDTLARALQAHKNARN